MMTDWTRDPEQDAYDDYNDLMFQEYIDSLPDPEDEYPDEGEDR